MNKRRKLTHNISWDEYFINIAILSSLRSKDPITKVGACIVNNENIICATGYNGPPKSFPDGLMSWNKNKISSLDNKHSYIIHAEINAILNSNTADVKNCSIYITHFPCNNCIKVIIQSGIKQIFYLNDKKNDPAGILMLNSCNVKYKKIKN